MKSTHRQVSVWNPFFKENVNVDEGIAPLLEALWKRNIDTALSCQENKPGIIWICFTFIEDADKFLRIVMKDDNLRFETQDLWEWDVNMRDLNVDYDGTSSGPPEPWFYISVRFPSNYYAKILLVVENSTKKSINNDDD